MYPGPDPRELPFVPLVHQEEFSNSYGPPPPIQPYASREASYGYPSYTGPTFVMQPPAFNHLPHIVLDMVSCGLWVPFHALFWALHGR